MTDRDQVEADWLLEHGRTREEVARMQAATSEDVAPLVDCAEAVRAYLRSHTRVTGHTPMCRECHRSWPHHNSGCSMFRHEVRLHVAGLLE